MQDVFGYLDFRSLTARCWRVGGFPVGERSELESYFGIKYQNIGALVVSIGLGGIL